MNFFSYKCDILLVWCDVFFLLNIFAILDLCVMAEDGRKLVRDNGPWLKNVSYLTVSIVFPDGAFGPVFVYHVCVSIYVSMYIFLAFTMEYMLYS